MDLLEYQGKQLFAKHGIAVPSGEVADTVDQAVAAAEKIGYPVAIKAQVLIGGRGKAGGIKIAQNADEAREYADAIIGMDIVGPHGEGPFRVDQVWVEGGSDIAKDFDAAAARPIVAAAGLAEDALDDAAEVLAKLAAVAAGEDATLIEVNPLI